MKQIKCELCGSTDFVKEDGFFVCQYCGAKYSVEEAKKMMIEGTVDVSGSTVKVDESANLENWYTIARRARDAGDSKKAEQYYEMIMQKAPDDWEAVFYSAFFRASGTTYADAANETWNLINNIPEIIDLIKDIDDERGQKDALSEVCAQCMTLSEMINASMIDYYDRYHDIQGTFNWDAVNLALPGSQAAAKLIETLAVIVKTGFDINDNEIKNIYKALLIKGIKINEDAHKGIKVKGNAPNIFKDAANSFQAKLKEVDDTYVVHEVQNPSGCYVATAVYGSYDCPEVWTLRRYRDYNLAESWYGRAFIHTYYAISPTLVKWFGHTDWFRNMWKGKLDRMVKDLRTKGYEDTPYEDRIW